MLTSQLLRLFLFKKKKSQTVHLAGEEEIKFLIVRSSRCRLLTFTGQLAHGNKKSFQNICAPGLLKSSQRCKMLHVEHLYSAFRSFFLPPFILHKTKEKFHTPRRGLHHILAVRLWYHLFHQFPLRDWDAKRPFFLQSRD